MSDTFPLQVRQNVLEAYGEYQNVAAAATQAVVNWCVIGSP